jgi:hypothetical protein
MSAHDENRFQRRGPHRRGVIAAKRHATCHTCLPFLIGVALLVLLLCACVEPVETPLQGSTHALQTKSFCASGGFRSAPHCSALASDHQEHICAHDFAAKQGMLIKDLPSDALLVVHSVYRVAGGVSSLTFQPTDDGEFAFAHRGLTLSVANQQPVFEGTSTCQGGSTLSRVKSYAMKASQTYTIAVQLDAASGQNGEDALVLVDPAITQQAWTLDQDCDKFGADAVVTMGCSVVEGAVQSASGGGKVDPNDQDACVVPNGEPRDASCTTEAAPTTPVTSPITTPVTTPVTTPSPNQPGEPNWSQPSTPTSQPPPAPTQQPAPAPTPQTGGIPMCSGWVHTTTCLHQGSVVDVFPHCTPATGTGSESGRSHYCYKDGSVLASCGQLARDHGRPMSSYYCYWHDGQPLPRGTYQSFPSWDCKECRFYF